MPSSPPPVTKRNSRGHPRFLPSLSGPSSIRPALNCLTLFLPLCPPSSSPSSGLDRSLHPHPGPPCSQPPVLPSASASGSSPEQSGLSHSFSPIFSPRNFYCPPQTLMVAQTPSALYSFVCTMLVRRPTPMPLTLPGRPFPFPTQGTLFIPQEPASVSPPPGSLP